MKGIAIVALILSYIPVNLYAAQSPTTKFTQLYSAFLLKYWHASVNINGIDTTVFEYARMAKDWKKPDSLQSQIENILNETDTHNLSEETAKAFWMNVYNFAAMRLVSTHYPIESIRSFKINLMRYPWSQKVIDVGGQHYSLSQIEKSLLERFADPRIIFGVSCAAVSCPDRTASAFTAQLVDKQLNALIQNFLLNLKKGAYLDTAANELTLSWIFKKDRHLFSNEKQGILGFIYVYLTNNLQKYIGLHKDVKVKYFKHDWTLNDIALSNTQK